VSKEELNETMVLKTNAEHHRTKKVRTLLVPRLMHIFRFWTSRFDNAQLLNIVQLERSRELVAA
jgi:hypothetical protein